KPDSSSSSSSSSSPSSALSAQEEALQAIHELHASGKLFSDFLEHFDELFPCAPSIHFAQAFPGLPPRKSCGSSRNSPRSSDGYSSGESGTPRSPSSSPSPLRSNASARNLPRENDRMKRTYSTA